MFWTKSELSLWPWPLPDDGRWNITRMTPPPAALPISEQIKAASRRIQQLVDTMTRARAPLAEPATLGMP